MYLSFKSYQIDKALISIYLNISELIQLIEIENERVKVSSLNMNYYSLHTIKEELILLKLVRDSIPFCNNSFIHDIKFK